VKINKLILYLGITWTLLFAVMSFYWAMGGMIGVRTLGGSIYEMVLNPSQSFIIIVWITGFIKILGALMLTLLLVKWRNSKIQMILYFIAKLSGIFLVLYGLLNFVVIFLGAIQVLSYEMDLYTTFWRLAFWEPYWIIGGIFYYFSITKNSKRKQSFFVCTSKD